MTPQAVAVNAAPARSADFLALTKPRLNLLVIATAAAGYYLGATGERFDYLVLLHTLMGTALVAGGSAAFNQLVERRVDALMVLCSGVRGNKRLMTVDELRKNIEALPPGAYDGLAYYEKWVQSLAQTLIQRGILSSAELAQRMAEVERRGG